MEPAEVLALCREHAAAEGEFDLDRVLATLVPDPTYRFFPASRALTGWRDVEDFYRLEYPRFARTVTSYEVLQEWVNATSALQEYMIGMRDDAKGGVVTTYRVMSMMSVDHELERITGETLYCDEGFVRQLLGSLWDRTVPLPV
jgi:hypothetical protein